MVVSVTHALANIRHTLGGGELSIELDKMGVLNQAGEYLINMHPWHWLVGRTSLLDLRGLVTGTTATWTATGNILTDAGAFASYTFVAGDKLEVKSGTGATTGFYTVASRVDDDSVTLTGSIAAGDLATGDIDYRLTTNTVALPDDFRDIVGISATDSLLYGVQLTSLEQILRNRTSQVEVTTSWDFQAAVVWDGSPPVPLLEVWPDQSTNQTGAWTIFYRGGWARLSGDSVNIDVPEFLDSLYLRLVRAWARGYEREDEMPMEEHLFRIKNSPEFIDAAKRDGMIQPYRGRLAGGGARIHSSRTGANRFGSIAQTIAGPSS